jgi:ribose transport system substrate-binding protein
VFTINDPQAIGADLAAKQLGRKGIVITSVDGAPDIGGAEERHRVGFRQPGSLRHGAAGHRHRLRHHERQAGTPVVLMPSS